MSHTKHDTGNYQRNLEKNYASLLKSFSFFIFIFLKFYQVAARADVKVGDEEVGNGEP